jgi:site-specific DNA recombinase
MNACLGFYLRLSMADGDLGKDNKDESNSIENQRDLLQSFIESKEEFTDEVIEYIDDGYTGTNFNRPAFRRMIDDAKKGRIHTILVKDLSRLGRDYIGVGDYLEQIFPVLGVRFIAVNSNYDSNRYIGKTMGLDMAVSNLVNSLYSRDISKKVKSGYRARWKQGISTSSRPPYGYIKDKTVKGGWRIDPEAAKVVRLIFEKASDGWNTGQITAYLNDEGYDTPSVHREKQNQYSGNRKVADSECLWSIGMIRTIIRRYEYTGAFVHNHRESLQVGTNITRAVPEHQQVIIENGHEAIISHERYESAQRSIQPMKKPGFKAGNDYPLRGKIRCGICRLAITRLELAYGAVYYCSHKTKSGRKSNCSGKYISAREIDAAVLYCLKTQLTVLRELGIRMEEARGSAMQDVTADTKRMEREIETYKAERIRQYEAYAEGVISREAYLSKKEELTGKIDSLQTALDRLRSLIEADNTMADEFVKINEQAERSMVFDTLTKEMSDAFIETVYVYDEKKIEVEFKFDDLLQEAAKKLT